MSTTTPLRPAAPPASSADAADRPPGIGEQIRSMRQRRDWTLQELSDNCGISVSMLSQIERNLASPSIRSLQRLAETFGVPIGWFFSQPNPAADDLPWIQRRAQRRVLDLPAKGIVKEMLSPDADGRLQLMLITVAPGGSSGESPYAHVGEDAGTVLAGTLRLVVDGVEGSLNAGDSFRFASTLPHSFANPGAEKCVVLWAVTPPLY